MAADLAASRRSRWMSELHSAKVPTHCPRTSGYDLSFRKMGCASSGSDEKHSRPTLRFGNVLSVDLVRLGVRVSGDALLFDIGVAVGEGGHMDDLHVMQMILVKGVVLCRAPQQRVRSQAVPCLARAVCGG